MPHKCQSTIYLVSSVRSTAPSQRLRRHDLHRRSWRFDPTRQPWKPYTTQEINRRHTHLNNSPHTGTIGSKLGKDFMT